MCKNVGHWWVFLGVSYNALLSGSHALRVMERNCKSITTFVPFDSADLIRVFPPFPAQVCFSGNLLTRQDALCAWRRLHAHVPAAQDASGSQRVGCKLGKPKDSGATGSKCTKQ